MEGLQSWILRSVGMWNVWIFDVPKHGQTFFGHHHLLTWRFAWEISWKRWFPGKIQHEITQNRGCKKKVQRANHDIKWYKSCRIPYSQIRWSACKGRFIPCDAGQSHSPRCAGPSWSKILAGQGTMTAMGLWYLWSIYPLVNIQKAMENHHFSWENSLYMIINGHFQ